MMPSRQPYCRRMYPTLDLILVTGLSRVFIWRNFPPTYQDPDWKKQDLGNRASLSLQMNTSKILHRIWRWYPRNLGNQAQLWEKALRELMSSISKTWANIGVLK